MWPVNRDEARRIAALQAAVEFVKTCTGENPDTVIRTASQFEDYIKDGRNYW